MRRILTSKPPRASVPPFLRLPIWRKTQFISLPHARSSSRRSPSRLYLDLVPEDELLTSIPLDPPPVTGAKHRTPIESLLTALVDFELSVEIRDRLTRAELVSFDKVFVDKVKDLGKYSVEGTYSQHLQVLKRLTKARAHLKKYKPEVVDDLSRIVENLLEVLGRGGESDVSPFSYQQEVSSHAYERYRRFGLNALKNNHNLQHR